MPASDDYITTPPYRVLAPTAMLDRGHVLDRRGRCEVCGERRPERGGWDRPCRGVSSTTSRRRTPRQPSPGAPP